MQETRALILDRLAAGPVSGPTLAADLDISRAAVWNHVETLRDDGFEIRDTDDGYTLAGFPSSAARRRRSNSTPSSPSSSTTNSPRRTRRPENE